MKAAQRTFDAYELVSECFERLYLFVLRLNESLSAKLVTSTALETYALVVNHVLKIFLVATKYAGLGHRTCLPELPDFRILLESTFRSHGRIVEVNSNLQRIRRSRNCVSSIPNQALNGAES
jgi:hypothetical protein